jgi:nitrogen fixation protein FixH
MIDATTRRRSPRRDRWIPWAFVAFFLTFIAVDAVMVMLAVGSFSGVATENAYQKGLAYNRTLEAAERQKALGWSADIAFAGNGPQAGRLLVRLVDGGGRPLAGASVSAELVRPLQAGYDFTVPLDGVGDRYQADIALPLPGQWEVRLTAEDRANTFRHSQRIFVR